MHRIQLTVQINAELRDRLKLLAVKRRKKLWELVTEVVEAYLVDVAEEVEAEAKLDC
jgi:predicted DNA-binding protein